jgi:hypothetical protein
VSQVSVERWPVSSFGILLRGKTGTVRGPWKQPAVQSRLTVAFGGGQQYLLGRRKVDNGNSGLLDRVGWVRNVPGQTFDANSEGGRPEPATRF